MTTILIILAAAYVQIKAASIWLFIVLYVSAGPLCLHLPRFRTTPGWWRTAHRQALRTPRPAPALLV